MWLPVLRAASRVSGRASENRCPGRAILPPIPDTEDESFEFANWGLRNAEASPVLATGRIA